MLEHKVPFQGSFNENCIEDSLPSILLQFVCMMEHGADIKSQLMFGASKTDLAMAQLLQYNCYTKYKEGAKTFRRTARLLSLCSLACQHMQKLENSY